jgi:hypothetical protein
MGRALLMHVLRDHVGIGGALALCASPLLGPTGALVFWLTTIFIDADHHAAFVWRTGWRNLFRIRLMLAYHRVLFETRPGRDFVALSPFHTVEVLVLLALASHIWPGPITRGVLWGSVAHVITDVVHLIRAQRPFARAHSVCEYFIRRQRLIASGFTPDRPFHDAWRQVAPE